MLMEDIQYDLYRITGKIDGWTFIKTLFSNRAFRRLYYYRKYRQNGRVGKKVISILSHMLFTKMSIELPWSIELGKGVLLLHPYSITFNSKTIIGDNCTIMKGVTIGNTKGPNGGTPIIGNNVYIGLNATVIGNIHIGNNVLIAPNSFVNFDVPDGALVIGNPGVVHKKEKASSLYIVNSIEEMRT